MVERKAEKEEVKAKHLVTSDLSVKLRGVNNNKIETSLFAHWKRNGRDYVLMSLCCEEGSVTGQSDVIAHALQQILFVQ
jgi:hypothetical protein